MGIRRPPGPKNKPPALFAEALVPSRENAELPTRGNELTVTVGGPWHPAVCDPNAMTPSGSHSVVVSADGFASETEAMSAGNSSVVAVTVALSPDGDGDGGGATIMVCAPGDASGSSTLPLGDLLAMMTVAGVLLVRVRGRVGLRR